ncbi:MAG: hypothetical protein G8237_14880 [Magnetococcales bacterium]|nr:hypothetical protein [Magnetococcales bacterium]
MNTGESVNIFSDGQQARAAGKPITSNPYSKNGSGAWLMWQAGWMLPSASIETTNSNPAPAGFRISGGHKK